MYTKKIENNTLMIAVVIPSYKVERKILGVIGSIGSEVSAIYVIDDACPQNTANLVELSIKDTRVIVIRHRENMGVGASVITGYLAAIKDGADIIVKVDGDGQMDLKLLPALVNPIITGRADYTKGNRFFNIEDLVKMPKIRLVGNSILSLLTKLSSGYWDIFDPTNGFTAIHASVVRALPLSKISKRYFFESDMLFRLSTLRAVVLDIPMPAIYSDEISNLKISKIIFEFLGKNIINFYKRIFYNYYLRGMTVASFELPIGFFLFIFGLAYGGYNWFHYSNLNQPAPTGTIMIAVLSLIIGVQFLLAFINYDVFAVPKKAIHD